MSLSTEIQRLKTNADGIVSDTHAILEAIAAKGVTIPEGSKLKDCPGLISSISSGGGDVGVYLQAIVPVSGGKVFVVDEMGYIGCNSLPTYFPSAYTSYAFVVSGADFSDAGLGQVTLIDPGTADIGGRSYRTVSINGVIWLAENLDFKGSGINIGPSGVPSTPSAWYYNNDENTYGVSGNKYGLLYNLYAVNYLNENRDVLMPGWHVPTKEEWDSLVNAVGGSSVAGTKLKSSTGWSSGNGTDDFGFTAFPAGERKDNSFNSLGSLGRFWTSSVYSSGRLYYGDFTSSSSMQMSNSDSTFSLSIRLVKDS